MVISARAWTGLYTALILCFFLSGLFFRSFAWVAYFVLPLMVCIFCGYFVRDLAEALSAILLGVILYGIVGAVLCIILSTFEPFWTYLGSGPFARAAYGSEITTFYEAFGSVIALHIGFLLLQGPLGAFGVLVGTGANNVKETLRHAREGSEILSLFDYGFFRAIIEFIIGIVIAVNLRAFADSGGIPYSFILFFHLANVLTTTALVFVVPFFVTGYIVEWLVDLAIMSSGGILGTTLEFVIYSIPLFLLFVRLWNEHARAQDF